MDVGRECRRLVEGFEHVVGGSETLLTLTDMQKYITVPKWQRSPYWEVCVYNGVVRLYTSGLYILTCYTLLSFILCILGYRVHVFCTKVILLCQNWFFFRFELKYKHHAERLVGYTNEYTYHFYRFKSLAFINMFYWSLSFLTFTRFIDNCLFPFLAFTRFIDYCLSPNIHAFYWSLSIF